jgi:hypothetical protein
MEDFQGGAECNCLQLPEVRGLPRQVAGLIIHFVLLEFIHPLCDLLRLKIPCSVPALAP